MANDSLYTEVPQDILVRGGTFSMDNGTEAWEPAFRLPQAGPIVSGDIARRFNTAQTLDDVRVVLDYMIDQNLNFVGSYGRVFGARGMLSVLKYLTKDERKTANQYRALTRCCGLRQAVARILPPYMPQSLNEGTTS